MAIVADFRYEKIDTLLRRPSTQMEVEGKNNPRTAMRPPKKRPRPIFRGLVKAEIPQVKFLSIQ